jgi:hypothetical protein
MIDVILGFELRKFGEVSKSFEPYFIEPQYTERAYCGKRSKQATFSRS